MTTSSSSASSRRTPHPLSLPGLVRLDLGGCTLTDEALLAAVVGRPPTSLPSLRLLNLRGNRYPLEVDTLRRLASGGVDVALRVGQQKGGGGGGGGGGGKGASASAAASAASAAAAASAASAASAAAAAASAAAAAAAAAAVAGPCSPGYEEDECGICLSEPVALRAPCGHKFCCGCFRMLAVQSAASAAAEQQRQRCGPSCPYCRSAMIEFEYLTRPLPEEHEEEEEEEGEEEEVEEKGDELC
jgi:hypothetical protein